MSGGTISLQEWMDRKQLLTNELLEPWNRRTTIHTCCHEPGGATTTTTADEMIVALDLHHTSTVISQAQEKVVLNVGGSVWAMHWHPQPDVVSPPLHNFLAVAAYPSSTKSTRSRWMQRTFHRTSIQVDEQLIQIWEVLKTNFTKSRLAFSISHGGGTVYDLQWAHPLLINEANRCTSSSPQPSRLGLLSACMQDGTVRIFDVPYIKTFEEAPATPVISVKPLVIIEHSNKVLAMCMKWSPHSSPQLLVGLSDGSISLWDVGSCLADLNSKSEKRLTIPFRRLSDVSSINGINAPESAAVRCIEWCPWNPHLLVSCGQDRVIRLWDVTETRSCIRSIALSGTTWIIHAKWISKKTPNQLIVSSDCGGMQTIDVMTGKSISILTPSQSDSPIWDISLISDPEDSNDALVASCDASGDVYLSWIDQECKRKRSIKVLTNILIHKTNAKKSVDGVLSFDASLTHENLKQESQDVIKCFRSPFVSLNRIDSFRLSKIASLIAFGGGAGIIVIQSIDLGNACESIQHKFFVQEQPEGEQKEEPLKKLGRPRKHPHLYTDKKESKTLRKRGRPKKELNDEESKPKRKRGRPRKSLVEAKV